MSAELSTTNLLLGIMAAVSVLEALVIIGVGVAGFMVYKRVMALTEQVMTLAQGIEARQVAPAMLRVNAILDDVKGVTATVKAGDRARRQRHPLDHRPHRRHRRPRPLERARENQLDRRVRARGQGGGRRDAPTVRKFALNLED